MLRHRRERSVRAGVKAAAARSHNRLLGTGAGSEAFGSEYLDRGFSIVSFGTDVYPMQSALSRRIAAVGG
jgi:2-keto-3-deoxy-L-rhamnonate aldolase RhmA